jgi:hypothetical protein
MQMRHVTPDELIDRHINAAEALAAAAKHNVRTQREMGAKVKAARADGHTEAIAAARQLMWQAVYAVYQHI